MINRFQGLLTQNIILPALLLPTRSQMPKLSAKIRNRQRWQKDQLSEWQLKRLISLIELAQDHSAFYRERFAESGICPKSIRSLKDLESLPLTTKSDLEQNFPERMIVAEKRSSDWQYIGTRGTTHRVMVVQDFERRDVGRAAIMVAMTADSPYRMGARELTIPPDACSVHCGIESNRAPSVRRQLWSLATRQIKWDRESISDLRGLIMDRWIRRSTALPPLALDDGDDSLKACVATLRLQRPAQLVALPEYLRALGEYINRTGDAPHPIPIIRPMGANMPVSWKADIATAFRGSVREHYGSREMGPMAFDCKHTNGMHLMMDQHLIEIIRDGRHAKPGEVGRVVVTDLNNFAMPIIRYEIGDLARVDHSPCECGRNTPRIHLEGRIEDAIVTNDSNVLTADAVSSYLAGCTGIKDFQLTEDRRNRLTLRLVKQPGTEPDIQKIADQFSRWAEVSTPLKVRWVDAIQPEASGKFRHCKSESYHSLFQTKT